MPNLDEIKARRGKINGASWKAVEGNSNDIRSSVFAGNDLLATLSSWKRHEYADFIANAPTDIDWLIGEVERLLTEVKAEKAQAEAEAEKKQSHLEFLRAELATVNVDTYDECHPLSTHAHLVGTTYPADTPACPKCGKAMPDCECEHEYEFKPFQQVLVRDTKNQEWAAAIFSHKDRTLEDKYVCVGYDSWKFCIPFCGNEHLLGTTNEPK